MPTVKSERTLSRQLGRYQCYYRYLTGNINNYPMVADLSNPGKQRLYHLITLSLWTKRGRDTLMPHKLIRFGYEECGVLLRLEDRNKVLISMRTLNRRTQRANGEPYRCADAPSRRQTLVTRAISPSQPYYLIPTRILNDQTRGTNEEPYRCAVATSLQRTLVTKTTGPCQPYYLIAVDQARKRYSDVA